METFNKINILVVGDNKWYNQHLHFFKNLQKKYNIEYIFNIQQANERLWHNNYDMLLIDQDFCKRYTINLSQLSYARSKPSIILCDCFITQCLFKLWKKFSALTRDCPTMKKLTYIYSNINDNLINQIDRIVNLNHNYRNIITKEIKTYFE